MHRPLLKYSIQALNKNLLLNPLGDKQSITLNLQKATFLQNFFPRC